MSRNARSRSGNRRPDQCQHAQREGGVGRHRDAPSVGRGMTGVDGQVDRDRDGHAAEGGENRQRQPAPLAQLADVELAPHLEPDDEEEECHQAAVDPIAQALGDPRVADPGSRGACARRLVGGEVDVGPGQRRQGRAKQDDGAAGFGAQKLAQRRFQAASPGRSTGEGAANPRLGWPARLAAH